MLVLMVLILLLLLLLLLLLTLAIETVVQVLISAIESLVGLSCFYLAALLSEITQQI